MRRRVRANRLRRHRLAAPRNPEVTAAGCRTATGADVAARPVSASRSCAGRPAIRHEESTMTITLELEAQILRYYHVEKWRVGTIVRQLRLHSDTVARVLAQAGVPTLAQVARPSQIDAYLP